LSESVSFEAEIPGIFVFEILLTLDGKFNSPRIGIQVDGRMIRRVREVFECGAAVLDELAADLTLNVRP